MSDEVNDVKAAEDVIDVKPNSAETVPVEVKEDEETGATYDVEVVTRFQVTGPAEIPNNDMKLLERALWEAMPAGFIGGELFVKFPQTSRNFNVVVKASRAEGEADTSKGN